MFHGALVYLSKPDSCGSKAKPTPPWQPFEAWSSSIFNLLNSRTVWENAVSCRELLGT